jgi:hypothetical protein
MGFQSGRLTSETEKMEAGRTKLLEGKAKRSPAIENTVHMVAGLGKRKEKKKR